MPLHKNFGSIVKLVSSSRLGVQKLLALDKKRFSSPYFVLRESLMHVRTWIFNAPFSGNCCTVGPNLFWSRISILLHETISSRNALWICIWNHWFKHSYCIEFLMRIQYYFCPVMHHFFRQLLLPTATTVNLSGVSTLINFRVN